MKRIFYISTGRLNARYTLRCTTVGLEPHVDNYFCVLADDLLVAIEKAKMYFSRFADLNEDTLITCPDFVRNERRSTFSVKQTSLEAKKAASQYVGTFQEKIVLDCVIERIYDFETVYGWQSIVTMWSGENCIVYKGSACLGDVGDEIKISCRVKKHSEYKGTKQTIIQRPSVKTKGATE